MKELDALREAGLFRSLRQAERSEPGKVIIEGRELVDFASNDYLGFATHPALREAVLKELTANGIGSGASRLVSGSHPIFQELETALAQYANKEAALTFATGYATATGCLPAIVGRGDTIIMDKLSHACLIDGARLSGATLRVFPHNHLGKLERLLTSASGRVLIVTESVFSMDGDRAALTEICALKEQHRALLWVDEAHAHGVIGPQGEGLIAELGLQDCVDFHMGTLGKALGAAGGYVAATQDWIDLFINKARSLVYSTAPLPVQAAAALAGLKLLTATDGQKALSQLRSHRERFQAPSAIVPIILGDNETALTASQKLQAAGFFVPAIRYPTVPRGSARLRLTLSAHQNSDTVDEVAQLLEQ